MTDEERRRQRREAGLKSAQTKGPDRLHEAGLKGAQIKGKERLRQAVAAIAVAELTGARTIGRYDYGSLRHRLHRVPPVTGDD